MVNTHLLIFASVALNNENPEVFQYFSIQMYSFSHFPEITTCLDLYLLP